MCGTLIYCIEKAFHFGDLKANCIFHYSLRFLFHSVLPPSTSFLLPFFLSPPSPPFCSTPPLSLSPFHSLLWLSPCMGAGKTDQSAAGVAYDALVNQLLTLMDGLNEVHNILVIGLTNRRELLDPALLRPGRYTTPRPAVVLGIDHWSNQPESCTDHLDRL